MGTIREKAKYLKDTVGMLRQTMADRGVEIADSDTLRECVGKLQGMEYYLVAVITKEGLVPPSGGTRVLEIRSNDSWTIHAPEWLVRSQTSGKGDARVTLTFPTDYDREGRTVLAVQGEHGGREEIEVMCENAPLIFETDGMAAEPYSIDGVSYMTEVGRTQYKHTFSIMDNRLPVIKLNSITRPIDILSTPVMPTMNKTVRRFCSGRIKGMIVNGGAFYQQYNIEEVKILAMDDLRSGNQMFRQCTVLREIDMSGWNKENLTDVWGMFWSCQSLKTIDFGVMDWSSIVKPSQHIFNSCDVLTNIRGVLSNINVEWNVGGASLLTRESALVILNGLKDRTGESALTVYFHKNTKALLTPEDIAIASAKNWTIG